MDNTAIVNEFRDVFGNTFELKDRNVLPDMQLSYALY
jgi:hypothetical protein